MKALEKQLIACLADGKFHSGEELGKILNLSRSGVWKTLQNFAKLGIEINSIKGKGYQILGGLELLDLENINNHLPACIKNQTAIEILLETSSTNQYLLDHRVHKPSGSIALAEYQTHGRGRRHRLWISPFGTNIYFSILWSFDKDPSELSGLSLAAGVAIVNALERYGICSVQLKWPNDILWNQRKLGGVLIEMISETHSSTQIVLGIGLNLKMPNTITIDQNWIDVANITHTTPKRNLMTAILIEEIVTMLQQFELNGFAKYFKYWQALDVALGKAVTLTTSTQEFHGTGQGINRQGEFILLDNENKERRFLHGEVSLRIVPI